ncbi:hypothetical protein A1Q2_00755 [Trichosporon asahii var. asahii CBS 8904]|uniref:Uncharacterized protein n=1 Tax=Trichosporon asahii var. asahii (strain CBS 8904) TaxID=1220162 RepID=K1VL87_TRIAC|nr:hypothetical protein A1Q2_00755 [Trichosporon asahii var. asahii CBS 8904]
MKLVFLLLFAFLVVTAPLGVLAAPLDNDLAISTLLPSTSYEKNGGARFAAQHKLKHPSRRSRHSKPIATATTHVDIESELDRLGLSHLDLQNWITNDDPQAVERQYAKLRALSPASSYRAKAHALACLVSMSDHPPRSLVWEYEWSIFYGTYLDVSTHDERTRELVEYYYDRVRRVRMHSSIRERAAAVARLVSLTANPTPDLIAQLEGEVPRDFAAYVCSAREWMHRAAEVIANWFEPIRRAFNPIVTAWNTISPYFNIAKRHSDALGAYFASYWV